MAKNVNHVSLIKSTNTAMTSGDSVFIASGQTGPKLPTPDVLIQGEIAVNLAKGVETLSIKNTDNEIVTFSSDKIIKKVIVDNERITAAALNDLEVNKQDVLTAGQGIDITNNVISATLDVTVDDALDSGSTNPVANSAITGEFDEIKNIIDENELIIAAALNDLDERKLDASAYTPTDLSDLYALSAVVSANSVVVAAALNDLNTRLLPTITGVSFNEQLAYVDGGVAYLDGISAHTHAISEVDGLQASLNSKVSGITVNNANKVTPTNGVANLTINANTVGALPTGTTLDGIPDGTNRKLTDYATTIEYYSSGSTHEIRLKNGNTTLATVNANDFIKDGMVDDVTVDEPTSGQNSGVTCLIVTFNTDAGKEDIEIPLSKMFDSSLFYTKEEIDDKLGSGFTGENSGVSVTEIIEENELIVASALNDLNERKLDASAYTPTDLSDLYILSGKVDDNAIVTASALNELNERLYDKLDASAYTQVEVDSELNSGSTNPVANSAITTTILKNEEVVAEALADLDSRISGNTTYITQVNAKADTIARSLSGYTPSGYSYSKGEAEVKLADKLDASAYTPTDLSGYYTKQEIDENKLGSGFTGANSSVTVTQAINETEEVVAAALNDLNNRIESLDGDIETLESAIQHIDLPTIDGDSDLWSSGSTGVPATSALTEVLEEIEEVTATALNDLNDKIAEVSGNQLTADSFKTINNESIIGSGNIEIQGGGGGGEMNVITGISVNNVEQSPSNKVVNITVPTSLSQITSAHTHSEYINTGSTAQTKNGNLGVNNLIVRGSNTSNSTRFITSDATNNIYASINGTASLVVTNTEVRRGQSASSINLGTASYPWNNAYAKAFVTNGGTSAQFVKGDGTLDNTVYAVAANTISGVSLNGSAVTVTNHVAAINISGLTEYVTITTDSSQSSYVATKTYAEIVAMINEGKDVILVYEIGPMIYDYYHLYWYAKSGGNIAFSNDGKSSYFKITNADVITKGVLSNVTSVTVNGDAVTVTDGVAAITAVTAETQLSTASTGTGSVVTGLTVNNHEITMQKGNVTLDNVDDGTTRKLSNYATTGTVNTLNNTVTAHTANTSVHVTAADKSTWNGKQDAIRDLDSIRTSAATQSDWNATSGVAQILNKPTIPAAPGTLTTTAATAQATATNEALSGNIALHKVSKTGSYNDLIGTPTIPTNLNQLTSAHTHTISEVTNLQTTLNAKVSGVTVNGAGKVTPTNGVVNVPNNYVTGGSVNTSDGTITLNRNGGLANVSVTGLTQYVGGVIDTAIAGKVSKTGDTMSGPLTISAVTSNTLNVIGGTSSVANQNALNVGSTSRSSIFKVFDDGTPHVVANSTLQVYPESSQIGISATVANTGATGLETNGKVIANSFVKSGGTSTQILMADGSTINLPSFSSADNGKILGIVNGQLAWVTPTTIYTGTGTPSSSQGNDGDIYLQTS